MLWPDVGLHARGFKCEIQCTMMQHGTYPCMQDARVEKWYQGWFEAVVGPSGVLLKRGMAVSDKARWVEPAKLKPIGNMMGQGEIHVLQRKADKHC